MSVQKGYTKNIFISSRRVTNDNEYITRTSPRIVTVSPARRWFTKFLCLLFTLRYMEGATKHQLSQGADEFR